MKNGNTNFFVSFKSKLINLNSLSRHSTIHNNSFFKLNGLVTPFLRVKISFNKITHILTTSYQLICYQEDPIKNWQRLWGSKILNTNLGALLRTLEKKALTPCPVGQWTATTKCCHNCGTILKDQFE